MTEPKCVCGHPELAHRYNTESYPYGWDCSAVMCVDNYKYHCQCHDLRPDVVGRATCAHTDYDEPPAYYGTSDVPSETDWNYDYCPKCGEKL